MLFIHILRCLVDQIKDEETHLVRRRAFIGKQHPDDDEVEDPSGGTLNQSPLMEIFGPHDSFGGKFVNPGRAASRLEIPPRAQ